MIPFNRSPWKKLGFKADQNPPWPCPTCGGTLSKYKDTFDTVYGRDLPSSILNLTKEEIPHLEYLQYRFIGKLECNQCNSKVIVSGYAHNVSKFNGPVQHGFAAVDTKMLYPIAFDPPLRLFVPPTHCPTQISLQLLNAFYHYWNDKASSANRIRAVVEFLMDSQGIPNPNGTTLHHRILEFQKTKDKELGGSLEAIKWIGNAGSHIQILNKIDLLNAFELLNHVLHMLYPDGTHIKRVKDLTTEINKNRGPHPSKDD
jgi:hypothetical protein